MKRKLMCRLMLGSQKCLGWTTLNNGPNQNMHVAVTTRQDEQPLRKYSVLITCKPLSVYQGNEILQWILYQVFAVL